MKVKSIFVSMLAIAALASCSRQEFVDPGLGPQEGSKMLVDITLSNGEQTKAQGVATADDDKKINDVTVFFLNNLDQIVSKQWVEGTSLTDGADGVKTATVETRSTATKMMVIANIGEDRTTGTLNVSTKANLEGIVQSLINDDNPPLPVQVKGEVFMSGEGTVLDMTPGADGAASTATAAVTLNFVAAKITLSKIELGNDVKGVYGEDFKFTRAFLLNVQTNSWYFPTAASYLPDAKAYANGVAWDADNWGSDDPGYPVVADFNQSLTAIASPTDLPKENIAHWYVFENKPATVADHPTILVVEVEWRKVKAGGEIAQDEKVKKMFNVIFHSSDKGVINAGKAYDVSLTFNGNFLPEIDGGNGGGGSETPDEPNVNANVSITVTPADWTTENTEKPFE